MLTSHTPQNIQKRKKARESTLPQGASRYIPTSPEFMSILEVRASKPPAKKSKKSTMADAVKKPTPAKKAKVSAKATVAKNPAPASLGRVTRNRNKIAQTNMNTI